VALPPVGIDPFKVAGVLPSHIACAALTELLDNEGMTEIVTGCEIKAAHIPDDTVLLKYVVAVKADGL
jgi:hypothetical protein